MSSSAAPAAARALSPPLVRLARSLFRSVREAPLASPLGPVNCAIAAARSLVWVLSWTISEAGAAVESYTLAFELTSDYSGW